jgi:hypothetical protein
MGRKGWGGYWQNKTPKLVEAINLSVSNLLSQNFGISMDEDISSCYFLESEFTAAASKEVSRMPMTLSKAL